MKYNIDLLKGKDQDAWAVVYEECADAVYRHAVYRLGGDRTLAEDVTQEAFVRAIESVGSFRGNGADLLYWLRGISRRIMARRARSLKPVAARPRSLDSQGQNGDGAELMEPPDPRPPVDEQMARLEEQRLTGAALTALSSRWELALRWKYCDNFSVAEIARRLEVTPKAAESLLSRARAAFRATYQQLVETDGQMLKVEDWPDE